VKVRFTARADRDYAALLPEVRKAFAKQLGFLLNQLGHPSLHAKKYDETNDIWQARVNRSWRFYFVIRGDEYVTCRSFRTPK
jgi:mRNA-degrading endonuclease RelE of RelBE toxin-antitoxin system